ncbi:unnamed protein product [Spodoptera littoralis]|uniref:Uncharacterized protein n=1 Tax=Spodoptera littoralis TaxID=7109 RepID=A0A9N8L195_SPOLI|nr:unnamed protein product [Spodoptera littoralis]CAD0233239.1 unnamed protein product [Spodoptera littoralis]
MWSYECCSVVLWSCLALSAVHCAVFLLVPESPAYLAAVGRTDVRGARALAWLRGLPTDAAALQHELRALPAPDQHLASPYSLTKRFLSEPRRRRTFWLVLAAVVGQEACGVLALLQYAERVFVLARDQGPAAAGAAQLASPARHAVLLGATQLLASVLALYLVEKVGRKVRPI